MPISKVGVLLIVGILAAVAAGFSYVSSETSFGGKLSDTLKHPTGLLTKVGFGGKEYATVEFTAQLTLDNNPALQLNVNDPVESLLVSYNSLNQKILLGDFSLSSTGDSEVELKGYKGSVSITDVVSFNGKTEKFRYDDVFTNEPVNVKAVGESVKYNKLELKGIPSTSLTFSSATGSLTAKSGDEEFTAKVKGQLQLNDFEGSLTLENNKVTLAGVASIKTSLLQTK